MFSRDGKAPGSGPFLATWRGRLFVADRRGIFFFGNDNLALTVGHFGFAIAMVGRIGILGHQGVVERLNLGGSLLELIKGSCFLHAQIST